MVDGVNSAEVFLSNMDYAQVAAAVITQEFIDGIQNDYLSEVVSHYPNRFFVCGMCEFRKPGFLEQAKELIAKGFKAIKIPADVYKRQALHTRFAKALNDGDLDELRQIIIDEEIVCPISGTKTVSYTHLDVYKRQRVHIKRVINNEVTNLGFHLIFFIA